MEVTIPLSLPGAQLVISSLLDSAAVGASRQVKSESAALTVWLPLVAGLWDWVTLSQGHGQMQAHKTINYWNVSSLDAIAKNIQLIVTH
jgi:hypothetical protein